MCGMTQNYIVKSLVHLILISFRINKAKVGDRNVIYRRYGYNLFREIIYKNDKLNRKITIIFSNCLA